MAPPWHGLALAACLLAGLLPALSTTRLSGSVRYARSGAPRLRAALLAFQLLRPVGTELWEQLRRPIVFAAGGMAVAFLALALAAVGTLGVFSYAVSERTREIGVRTVLGARARDIVRMLVTRLAWPLAGGLAAGLLGAQALGEILGNRLYGLSPRDPVAYLVVLAVLLIAAMARHLDTRAPSPARRSGGHAEGGTTASLLFLVLSSRFPPSRRSFDMPLRRGLAGARAISRAEADVFHVRFRVQGSAVPGLSFGVPGSASRARRSCGFRRSLEWTRRRIRPCPGGL